MELAKLALLIRKTVLFQVVRSRPAVHFPPLNEEHIIPLFEAFRTHLLSFKDELEPFKDVISSYRGLNVLFGNLFYEIENMECFFGYSDRLAHLLIDYDHLRNKLYRAVRVELGGYIDWKDDKLQKLHQSIVDRLR